MVSVRRLACLLAMLVCPLAVHGIVVIQYPCGDCDRSGSVDVDEAVSCASAIQQGAAACPSCDIDGDGEVTQEEFDTIWPPPIIGPGIECPPVRIDIGSAGRDIDGKVFIPITLDNGRFTVGGTQNDILFDNTVLSLPSVGRCRINPAIGSLLDECQNDPSEVDAPCKVLFGSLDVCGGDPQPDGCPADATSSTSRYRSLLTAFAPIFNPIPDGVLYECEFDVLDPDGLPSALINAEVAASEPLGQAIFDVVGGDGEVTDDPPPTPDEETATPTAPLPTATPTLSQTPTLTPTGTVPPTPVGVQITIGSAGADGEEIATIPVSLFSGGANVGGMQNDILFDNTIVSLAGPASCRINPAIGLVEECFDDPESITLPCKSMERRLHQCGTNPQPAGCPGDAPATVSRFRAFIASTAVLTTNPIPNGLLYTCTFEVLDPERLPAALINSNVVVSSPFGMRLLPVVEIDGAVTDEPPPPISPTPSVTATTPPTSTPIATSTSTPTATPSATPTDTVTPTVTPTETPTETPTATETDTATPTATVPEQVCTGDCDGSESVTVDEITLMVSIALGTQDLASCIAGDRDGDLLITVDELLTAVTNGLNGCPV